jgi:hypothetical protein
LRRSQNSRKDLKIYNTDGTKPHFVLTIGLFLSLFVLAFCLSALFLGMRRVMDLGGTVASGGPYAIAHPAPGWIWIMPVSIWAGLAAVFIHYICAMRARAVNFTGLSWPALFLSLGWNFFEYGFKPPTGHGLVWGWLICGVVFAFMGGIPLYFIVLNALNKIKNIGIGPSFPARMKALSIDASDGQNVLAEARGKILLIVEITAIVAGVIASMKVFNGFAG